MALKFTTRIEVTNQQLITATARLYETADGDLVEAGDPRAIRLFCIPGQKVAYSQAVKFGLIEQKERKTPVETKVVQPAETKEENPGIPFDLVEWEPRGRQDLEDNFTISHLITILNLLAPGRDVKSWKGRKADLVDEVLRAQIDAGKTVGEPAAE